MAAPTPVSRTPPGAGSYKVPEGFKCTITLTDSPGVWFWEIDPKPPALDGGEGIDTTTQLNTKWHTMSPQTLFKLDNITVKVAYDPDVWNTMIQQAMNNRFDTVTITYPTNDKLAFYGCVIKWEPEAFEIGKMPTATLTILVTNFDAANQIEAGPVYQSAGT